MGFQIARRSRRRKARKAQLIPDHCPCTVDAGKNHENALLLGTIKAKNKSRDLNRFVDGPDAGLWALGQTNNPAALASFPSSLTHFPEVRC